MSIVEATESICRFRMTYVNDWKGWLQVSQPLQYDKSCLSLEYAKRLKYPLGKWQACRPKRIVSPEQIRQTLKKASSALTILQISDLRAFSNPTDDQKGALCKVWDTFREGLCEDVMATEVGVTKAILLTTEGRIGPALDANVKNHFGIGAFSGPARYLEVLRFIALDLHSFESRNGIRVEYLVPPERGPVAVGRAVDMMFGPRK